MNLVFVYVLWNPSPQATSAAERGQRGKMPRISASQIGTLVPMQNPRDQNQGIYFHNPDKARGAPLIQRIRSIRGPSLAPHLVLVPTISKLYVKDLLAWKYHASPHGQVPPFVSGSRELINQQIISSVASEPRRSVRHVSIQAVISRHV